MPELNQRAGSPSVLSVSRHRVWTLTLNRPEERNVLNDAVLRELARGLDDAEADPACRVIVLEGSGGAFCTGMDFSRVSTGEGARDGDADDTRYITLLRRMSLSRKVVVARVEGDVMAGGVGLVAASDLVFAGRARFCLSEALWGLLPACVAPYLIRRVGFQSAYRMTLTTDWIDDGEAHRIGLVDVRSDMLDEAIRKQVIRLSCLTDETIAEMKSYFRTLSGISEQVEMKAVAETKSLLGKPSVQRNVRRYVESKRFPWEPD